MKKKTIDIWGAREHNLKNIDLSIPQKSLVVITGLSGSGKSSLAFDTIYAEGQRRYLETLSSYSRQFIGNMSRPDVDKIEGLSPVVAIEQKTTSKNPRSTVGTITEIYDYLRLLFARIGIAHSYVSKERMQRYTQEQIFELLQEKFKTKEIMILSPLVSRRKGHYRDLFENCRKKGYLKVRVDGEIVDLSFGMYVDRYKIHDIELVVDRIKIDEKNLKRLKKSVESAMKQGKGSVMILDTESEKLEYYSRNLMDPKSGISYAEAEPNSFSFNSPYGACPNCKGLGKIWTANLEKIIPNQKLSLKENAVIALKEILDNSRRDWIRDIYKLEHDIKNLLKKYNLKDTTPIEDWSQEALEELIYGSKAWRETEDERENKGVFHYIKELSLTSSAMERWAEQYMHKNFCPKCGGSRLNTIALHYFVDGKNIAELNNMSLVDLQEFLLGIEERLEDWQVKIGSEILKEIRTRLAFLIDVGIDYLSLGRESSSLSGGESQRIRLATQIGSKLVNVLYILDEPSIGLHQRDNQKLITSLKQLRDIGNSIIVVEHDEEMMLAADYIVDIGPGAGVKGGKIVNQGCLKDFLAKDSPTSEYLNGKNSIEIPKERRGGCGKFLELLGASGHNLKNVNLKIPLNTLCCISGVSGSGKSSLVSMTLQPILSKHFYRSSGEVLPYKEIKGIEHIDKVIKVDQSPIGRTPRSNPATYIGIFEDIRKLFSSLPEAKIKGYTPGRFSFNIKGGRCEKCGGAGVETIEMNFLPDVYVVCEECNGKRYNKETLEVRYKGKSISDVLNMSISQAVEYFENIPSIANKLKTIEEVGLGYISLGQSSTTLSGGEAQRIKLASELSKKDTGNTLYILDEPTTGLHFEDIKALILVMQKLVNQGNTVLVIEHNLDVIKIADYVIDMGPGGGKFGGEIVACGTPEEICKSKKSATAPYLKKMLHFS